MTNSPPQSPQGPSSQNGQQNKGPKRPLGITLTAFWLILGGILFIIFSFTGSSPGDVTTLTVLGVSIYGPSEDPIIVVAGLMLGVVSFVIGWGFFALKRWAFWLALILSIILSILSLILIYSSFSTQSGSINIDLSALIITFYLFLNRKVHKAFGVFGN